MHDDLPNSDGADHLLDDLLVDRQTDSDSAGFWSDLQKRASVDELLKTIIGSAVTVNSSVGMDRLIQFMVSGQNLYAGLSLKPSVEKIVPRARDKSEFKR